MAENGQSDPTASKAQQTFESVRRRAMESESWRSVIIDGTHTLKELWSMGPRRFHGDHWSSTPSDVRVVPQEGLHYSTINRTQTAMISTIAVMTERPMRVTFEPMETADEGLYYAKPSAVRILASQLDPESVQLDLGAMFGGTPPTEGQMSGEEPFSEAQFELLTQQPLVTADGMLGAMPLLIEDDFFKLNDATAGDALQTVYDALFDRAGGDAVMAEHVLYSSTVGTQFMLVQWDHDKRRPQYINADIVNVRPDPVQTRIADSNYVILDQVMPEDKAIAAWPKSEKAIRSASSDGRFNSGGDENEVAGRYQRTDFGRNMVQVRTMWERGVEYPLTDPNDTQNPHHGEGVDLGYFERDEQTGQYIPKVDSDGIPMEIPATVRGIRQVVLLPQLDAGDSVMEDQRCPYLDIPVCQTVNIPIIGSPYGIGEPHRLEDVQAFINELATTLINHLRYYSYPQEFWPQSLLDTAEKELGGSWYASPGVAVGVPDNAFREWFGNGQRTSFAAERPPLPTDMVNLIQLWFEVHDQISGWVNVLQGRPPTADSSGVAIQQLQQQARGPIGYKSGHVQKTLKRLGMLTADAIIKFLPEWDWTQYLSKYPVGVAMAFRDHVKSLKFDISAEVVSGKGVSKMAEQEQAIQRRGMNPPTISQKSFLELVDQDPEREEKRLEEEMSGMAEGENQAIPFEQPGALPGQQKPA